MRRRTLVFIAAQTNGEAYRRSPDRLAYASSPLMNAPLRLRRSDPVTDQHSWRGCKRLAARALPSASGEFLRFLLTDDLHGWPLLMV